MAKISTLTDAFTAPAINTALWNSITGTATLDQVNDLVSLAVPTANGATNSFGTTSTWDATGSSLSAQIGVAANGNGGVTTALKLSLNASNSIAIRVAAGVFGAVLTTASVSVVTPLPAYDPHLYRWWRISEGGGQFLIAAGADGLNWTTLATIAYTWSATAVTMAFQAAATVNEAAGNAATIQHLNTPLGGTRNPNWPLVEYGWGARWNCNGGDSPLDRYADQSKLTRGSVSISRGRQYELDQVRAGEVSLQLANPVGALDPINAAGPYFGHIMPFQPYRLRCQWPPTRNLLNQFQATGGDQGGIAVGVINQGNSGPSTFCSTDSANFQTVTSATAWQGGTVIQALVPSGQAPMTGSGTTGFICWTPQPAGEASAIYTMQVRVRNITGSTSVQVAAFVNSVNVAAATTANVGSTVTLTAVGTAWTTLTVTATLAADCASLQCGVGVVATTAAAATLQFDGWQLEPGGTASAWTCPAPWSPMSAGFVERWPSTWTMSGTYGMVQPTVTDAFSLLSQRQLSDPLTAEINSHTPRFLYTLNDPQGSATATDETGSYPAAPVLASKYGAGSFTFGNDITASSSTGTYTGSSGTVATVANANPGSAATSAATFLQLTAAGIKGPANPALWARAVAFRYTGPTPSGRATIWSSMDGQRAGGFPSGARLEFTIVNTGTLQLLLYGSTGAGVALNFPSTNVVDGNWHLAVASYDGTAGSARVALDGSSLSYSSLTGVTPTGLVSDTVGGFIDVTTGLTPTNNYKGDISFLAEFPSSFSASDNTNLYAAWKSACSGESTDARYARILRYAGYIGPSSIQTGLTTSMGPAAIGGQDAVTALQGVVDTEGGAHFVDRGGVVTFRSRSARYNAFTPIYIFGENTAAGEWPYEDCQLDFDSTHLANTVTVAQDSTGQSFDAQDQTSITNFFPRTLSRNVNSSSTLECQDAADYLLSRYKNPATRVSTIKLHPSGNPQMWPVCLALELGTRVRVMRRPPGAPPIAVECFVENAQWDLDDTGEATLTLQCSPADLTPYAVFAAWHTVTSQAYPIGTSGIAVKPNEDNTNPLAAQIAPGQQIILEPGTANAETLTVSTVGATSPGWTFGVLVMTSATTKAHPALAVISAALPAGVTDPAMYDASAVFDAVTFAY